MAGTEALAAAFQLREGSATAIGTALAGRTANDRDISLSVHNPASMRGVENFEVSFGASAIIPSTNARSPVVNATFPKATDDPSEAAFLPSLTLGYRILPDVVVGLAVDVPFGLATEYSREFFGSLAGKRSELTTIAVTPQVAWDVVPGFTLGAGVTLLYADAELSNFNPAIGEFKVSGDGFSAGVTLGAIIEPVKGTKFGVNVQTQLNLGLEGDFSANYPGGFGGEPARATTSLPAVVSVGAIQDFSDDFRMMAELEFTRWSAFDQIRLVNRDTGADIIDPQNYENSVMVSLGGEYDVNDALTLRAGVAYDQSPTSNEFRTVRVPDSDRIWLAAGASYQISERVGIDAAYLYIIADDTTVIAPGGAGTIRYDDIDVHLFSLNLNYKF